MDAATLATLSRLIDEALDRPPEGRQAWLDGLGPECAPLKPSLERLLRAHASIDATHFLHTLPKLTAPDTAGPIGAAGRSAGPGETFGPYRLVQDLGDGGMGSVWLAERTDGLLKRPVALKLPRGAWRRAGLAEWMAREREILASLDHPNIARLYDAGVTPDGQPFLVLEYVDGRPLDRYCSDARLGVEARLRLFQQVVRAVAHAHSRLVVHRDLKPSNVLVTPDGQVRLLDFGIAKLLEPATRDETPLTELAGRPLTPDYASPEQIAGAPITTASDIYSLGVVLFELLAGKRPYALAHVSPDAIEQAHAAMGPAWPSRRVSDRALVKQLLGDLDWIVDKAMALDPDRRYPSAAALDADIERHLTGEVVQARPPSRWYRTSRFVRRHRIPVAATVAIALALAGGAALAGWQATVARAEQQQAEAVRDFVTGLLRQSNPYAQSDAAPSVVALLQQAAGQLGEGFAGSPALRIELQALVGGALLQHGANEQAESLLVQAVDAGTERLGARHPVVLDARYELVVLYLLRGRVQEMEKMLTPLVADLEAAPGAPAILRVSALTQHANWAIQVGRYDEAIASARRGSALATELLATDDPRRLSSALTLAVALGFSTDTAAALEAAEGVLALAHAFYPDGAHIRMIEARALHARALGNSGRHAEAADRAASVVADAEQLLGPQALQVAVFSSDASRFALEAGRLEMALDAAQRTQSILAAHETGPGYNTAVGALRLGRAQLALRLPAAEGTLQDALARMRVARGDGDRLSLELQADLLLAQAYAGRHAEAAAELEALLPALRSAGETTAFHGLHIAGIVERLAGRPSRALLLQEEALATLDDAPAHAGRRERAQAERALAAAGLAAAPGKP